MRQRFLTARGGITALLVILFSLCLALGACFALPNAAYADGEEGGSQEVEDENNEEDEWNGVNDWIIKPVLVNWTEDEFYYDEEQPDGSVVTVPFTAITAEPRYGANEMYFKIFGYQDSPISENPILMPFLFENGQTDKTVFSLEKDGALPEYVCDVLSGLEAGTYYLLGVVPQTDKYSGINDDAVVLTQAGTTFKVLKKTEYKTLSITEWEWGTFDYRINVIDADIVADESLTITYTVANYDNSQIPSLNSFTADEDGMVNETTARVALNSLDAGDYWLIVSTGEHSTGDPFKVEFKVAPYSNEWRVAPSITEWTWGEYKSSTNIILGSAMVNDNGKTVSTIKIPVTDSEGNPIYDKDGKLVYREEEIIEGSGITYFGIYNKDGEAYSPLLENFTVGEGGIVNERIANELKALPAGEYNLRCWIENNNKNYVDISETIAFTVRQIPNSWSVSPYVLSWKYGDYDKELNVMKSEAVFGTKTQYAIYKDADCSEAVDFGGSEWFELNKNGLVPESVEAVLKTVDAGTYYLKCKVTNDNPNYAELSETIPFAVLQIPNSWVVAPSIISWNEGHFDIKDNPLSGTAKAGSVKFTVYSEKDNVLYIINTDENGVITSVTNPAGESLHISVLNRLSVGSYKLVAEVESTDNYSTLTTTAYFAVFEDSVALGGIIAATVTFAVVDIIAAALCITLLIIRRRKLENQFRNMVRKELGRK